MRGAEARGHLIELVRQIPNLVIGFNSHLVLEMAATELYYPLAESDDGLGKALAQDAGDTNTDEDPHARDAQGEPELARNRGIQNGLRLLDHHAPLSPGQVDASGEHAYAVFIDIVPLDELQILCAQVLHEVLDQR